MIHTFSLNNDVHRCVLVDQYCDFYILHGIFYNVHYDINFETDYTWYKL